MKHVHIQNLHAQKSLPKRKEKRRQTRRSRETPRLGSLQTHHNPHVPQQDATRRQTQRRPGGDGEAPGPPELVRRAGRFNNYVFFS